MNEKDPSEIKDFLADDFVWHSAVPEHKAPADDKADKAETIDLLLAPIFASAILILFMMVMMLYLAPTLQ